MSTDLYRTLGPGLEQSDVEDTTPILASMLEMPIEIMEEVLSATTAAICSRCLGFG